MHENFPAFERLPLTAAQKAVRAAQQLAEDAAHHSSLAQAVFPDLST
ncbi:hypothetical protein OG520_35735 [Streptomyces sp. NBC_00984]|nr:hypothetical protein OG520_35735 [Streptomyces sp. NBC_00984]